MVGCRDCVNCLAGIPYSEDIAIRIRDYTLFASLIDCSFPCGPEVHVTGDVVRIIEEVTENEGCLVKSIWRQLSVRCFPIISYGATTSTTTYRVRCLLNPTINLRCLSQPLYLAGTEKDRMCPLKGTFRICNPVRGPKRFSLSSRSGQRQVPRAAKCPRQLPVGTVRQAFHRSTTGPAPKKCHAYRRGVGQISPPFRWENQKAKGKSSMR